MKENEMSHRIKKKPLEEIEEPILEEKDETGDEGDKKFG